MTVPRIPIAEPVLGEEELANVVEAVRSGWISSLGAFIPEFERTFAAFCGAAHGIAVLSSSIRLSLATRTRRYFGAASGPAARARVVELARIGEAVTT